MTNGEIIKGLYAAFAKGDVPTVLGAMDPGIEWNETEGFMYGGIYRGPNAILENVFMKFATEWEGFSVVPDTTVDGGDGTVVSLGTYSGKYLKTGKSMSVPFAHAWEFRDGKIVRFRQYLDTVLVARQLGL
ncbi:MAG TPA: nuclear transport factor 2 family protein [Pyrinomonadaceae bacterium]|nr:nuclear transport factor 2 family protein [Pyrinomonadaceae bacterium]